ncbi:DUF551 domain-containing protein [Klebsiella pneumoniae]
MTKSTITRERIQRIIRAIDSESYDEEEIREWLTSDEIMELARMALAAMGSEPVFTLEVSQADYKGQKLGNHFGFITLDAARKLKEGNYQLYRHAQQAPVAPAVSDDIGEIRVGRLPTMNQDDYPGLGDWWVQLRIGEDSDEVLARVYGATPQEANNRAEALACRAAMLQDAEPVTTANKLPEEAVYGYFAFNDHHGEEFFKKREDAIEFCKEAIEEYRQENAEEGCNPDEVRRTCWGIIMQEGTYFEVDNEGHIDYALTPELAGNSPAIPDAWIPVSERMPEAGGDMIVFTDGIVMSGISYAKKKGFYIQALEYDDDEPVDNVTHWMPLPAAPQEVNHG